MFHSKDKDKDKKDKDQKDKNKEEKKKDGTDPKNGNFDTYTAIWLTVQ